MSDTILRAEMSQFAAAIGDIGKRLRQSTGLRDFRHLQKIERIGRLASLLGWATAWLFPNPLSAFLLAQGMIVRFTMGHHIGHGAYDHIEGIPARYTSRVFAHGWRRFIDWPDWWRQASWLHLHNHLHHPYTQDPRDADIMDPECFAKFGLVSRYLLFFFFTATWKFSFYAPYMEQEWLRHQRGEARHQPYPFKTGDLLNVLRPDVRTLLLRFYLPYIGWRFVLPTLLFLPLGATAATNVLLTVIMAELIHNAQTFICIRSSHSAPDLPLFESDVNDKAEYYVRQVLSTVNYNGGTDLTDILHVWTNYHIEHHLWARATLLQFQESRQAVKQACAAHNIPYIQQNVFKRYWMMSKIFTNLHRQPVIKAVQDIHPAQTNAAQ